MPILVQHKGYPPKKFDDVASARTYAGLDPQQWQNLLMGDTDDSDWLTSDDGQIQVKLNHPDFD